MVSGGVQVAPVRKMLYAPPSLMRPNQCVTGWPPPVPVAPNTPGTAGKMKPPSLRGSWL